MNLNNSTYTQSLGIPFTQYVTSSDGYTFISSSTYFNDTSDNLPRYKDANGNIIEPFVSASYALTASYVEGGGGITEISQTNTIYIDSAQGADNADANRGNIDKPYATVEYVLANVPNSGSITGDTNSGTNTIVNVADTSNIEVGQFITGTNIPYNSVVISKTASTVVLSQTATGTGTSITFTYWNPKLLKLQGDFTATSNWFKPGFYYDSNPTVTVQWGAFTLYDIPDAGLIPYVNNGEFNYYGTDSTSRWLYSRGESSQTDMVYTFKFNTIHSNNTGANYAIRIGDSGYHYGAYYISGQTLDADLGQAFYIHWSQHKHMEINIANTYGLTGGVNYSSFFNQTGTWRGNITCPSGITAITGRGNLQFHDGVITGNVTYDGGTTFRAIFTSKILTGPTVSLKNVDMHGSVPSNTSLDGEVDMYGYYASYINVNTGYNRIYRSGQFGIRSYNSATAEIRVTNSNIYNLATNDTSTMIIKSHVDGGLGATIGANTKFIVEDKLTVAAMTVNGELINNNEIIIDNTRILLSSTGTIRNYGRIECTNASATNGLITKDGGNLYLYPGTRLVTANGSGSLECTANTAASKDIYNFYAITNGDGATHGLLIAFNGSSFAANDLVGGTLYENTSY